MTKQLRNSRAALLWRTAVIAALRQLLSREAFRSQPLLSLALTHARDGHGMVRGARHGRHADSEQTAAPAPPLFTIRPCMYSIVCHVCFAGDM